jgi:N-acetylglucosamine-6-phosphate deacetylase
MLTAYCGADVFDGERLWQGHALVLEEGVVRAIAPHPMADARIVSLDGGTVMPGFVDLQVNGGGGVMFNQQTSVAGLRAMAEAHAARGTLGFLPTLITDTSARTDAAIAAVEAALSEGVWGILGLHLEGPHLDPRRKGAHDAALIRAMTEADLAALLSAAERLPNLMVTLAPESATLDQISALGEAGVHVSLGHSACSYEEAQAAFAAGATCVTHLFNAMSPLTHRAPGLAGAALDAPVSVGLIADGIHLHPAALRVALRAAAGNLYLVTDAMATVGSEITEFTLNGRRVLRRDGRLTLEDGTLAGADLDMPRAVQVLTQEVGLAREEALRRATSVPADVLRDAMGRGRLRPGGVAHAIHLAADGETVTVLDRAG